ncbi:MAG TPA: metalloregulator ArsR/SmtB family transcription factor [Steroidobacteraceae bacterium]|nr:metalloregulator ArsR/SmtB family transcription factor [Steroidobacteraceae bacterium]
MGPDLLDATFAALADPTRRAVIRALLQKRRRAGELAILVKMSPPALSRHLRVLRKAGLIVEQYREDDARVRVFTVDRRALGPVRDWLEQVDEMWQTQLEAFKAHAERRGSSRGS